MNWAFLDTNEGTVLYSWGGGGEDRAQYGR